jgi:hypothetical protein
MAGMAGGVILVLAFGCVAVLAAILGVAAWRRAGARETRGDQRLS